jgi:hypothetical protein
MIKSLCEKEQYFMCEHCKTEGMLEFRYDNFICNKCGMLSTGHAWADYQDLNREESDDFDNMDAPLNKKTPSEIIHDIMQHLGIEGRAQYCANPEIYALDNTCKGCSLMNDGKDCFNHRID